MWLSSLAQIEELAGKLTRKLHNECELDVLSTKRIACMGKKKEGIIYEGCSELCRWADTEHANNNMVE